MMHSIDREGRIVAVNDKWLEETGYKRNEVMGRALTAVLTPESAETVGARDAAALLARRRGARRRVCACCAATERTSTR